MPRQYTKKHHKFSKPGSENDFHIDEQEYENIAEALALFDEANVKGMPKQMLVELEKATFRRYGQDSRAIIFLFSLKPELTVREIMIGYWQKEKRIITYSKMYSTLYGLVNRKILRKTDKGYAKN